MCGQVVRDVGSGTALCLAAAAAAATASDRAGSLDSNSIIIRAFKSSAFLRDYAQQWNLTSSTAGDSRRTRSSPHSLSVCHSGPLTFCHLCEVFARPPPFLQPNLPPPLRVLAESRALH